MLKRLIEDIEEFVADTTPSISESVDAVLGNDQGKSYLERLKRAGNRELLSMQKEVSKALKAHYQASDMAYDMGMNSPKSLERHEAKGDALEMIQSEIGKRLTMGEATDATEMPAKKRSPAKSKESAIEGMSSSNPKFVERLTTSVTHTLSFIGGLSQLQSANVQIGGVLMDINQAVKANKMEKALRLTTNLAQAVGQFKAEVEGIYDDFKEGRDAAKDAAALVGVKFPPSDTGYVSSGAMGGTSTTKLIDTVLKVGNKMGYALDKSSQAGAVAARKGKQILDSDPYTGSELVSVVSDFAKTYGEFRDTVSVSLYTLINAMQKYLNQIDERLGRQTAVGVKAESFYLSLPRLEEDREFNGRFVIEEDSDISLDGIQSIFGASRHISEGSSDAPKQSIWGKVQDSEEVGDGIFSLSTAGHGGYWLAKSQNSKIPAQFRSKGGWYEEDEDWGIVVHFLADEFYQRPSSSHIEAAKERVDSGKPNFNKNY